MNIAQKKLVNAYATLIIAGEINIEEVPEMKIIGGAECSIRLEVELMVDKRTKSAA